MVGNMAESSSYVVREFHEKCFDKTQFILRTVMAPKTFYADSRKRRRHMTSLKLCLRHRFHIFQNQFSYIKSYYIIYYIRGGSIYNDNTLITPPTKALEFYAICGTKGQGLAFLMVYEILFNVTY